MRFRMDSASVASKENLRGPRQEIQEAGVIRCYLIPKAPEEPNLGRFCVVKDLILLSLRAIRRNNEKI